MEAMLGSDIKSINPLTLNQFKLTLDNNEVLVVEAIIRKVKNKRLLTYATWQGKQVFAKLFFHEKKAAIHAAAEAEGVQQLLKADILTPNLYYHGRSKDQVAVVLIYERINNCETLHDIWDKRQLISAQLPVIKQVIREIAHQHQKGILQRDINLNNYLINANSVYTIDCGHIEALMHPVTKKTGIDNLAAFISYFGVDLTKYYQELLSYYGTSRNIDLNENDLLDLTFCISRWLKRRWQRLSSKIRRESRDFTRVQTKFLDAIVTREHASSELIQLVTNIEQAFKDNEPKDETMHVRCTIGNQELLIQKFPTFSTMSKYSLILRNHGLNAWIMGQKLKCYGMKIGLPVAYIMTKPSRFTRQSYFISVSSNTALPNDFFRNDKILRQNVEQILDGLSTLRIGYTDFNLDDIRVDKDKHAILVNLHKAKQFKRLLPVQLAQKEFLASL